MINELANVWPQSGLFAFSGVDGETRHAEPFVAAGLADTLGWYFYLTPRVTARLTVNGSPLLPRKTPDGYCLSDCWHCAVADFPDIRVDGAFVDRQTLLLRIGTSDTGMDVQLLLDPAPREMDTGRLIAGNGWWLAVRQRRTGLHDQFGLAISYADADDALAHASAALDTDLDSIVRDRLRFYEEAAIPESLSDTARRAFFKAVSIQKVNIESPQMDMPYRWTTPDRMPHRHMWMWDTAFHGLGLQYLDAEIADEAMRALFVKQRPDGKLLLAVQPGQPNREEEDTQPPIVAWSLCHQNERNGRTECLQELYPAVVRYLEWFEHNRKNGHGLYGWRVRVDADPVRGARGGESGMDNSPRFDRIAGMTAVDLSCYMASEYRCMGKLAQCLGRTEDVAEWRRRHIEIARRVNALLWDDEDQFYYDLDEQDDFVPVKTTAGFMPLLAEIPDRDRAEALRMHLTNPKEFWSAAPLASVSQDERDFCQDMWRGPMWPNVNLLVYYGLMAYGFFQEARALGRATLREISHWYARTGCFYEYYDSTGTLPPPELPRKGGVGEQGGVGFGVVADLHWTAAVYVHLSNELG
ncbi:MAG TPA: trehalase family glycosidase [Candidatus Hydrogenedentes bacterium]|nr:trehalase family glycosidase [Candidatus Hydrogenedentota bacterium]HPC17087.1 trehalase family glycosidase [Candidatus Hydrogenedentota bacterium]HRT20530.1 trehalase family glycosidase [Candidatus Hydrogenedentota bacterium]HRT65265.1 trehalase family glycosidase [Candidatus Hydrogenedentota bacterium]